MTRLLKRTAALCLLAAASAASAAEQPLSVLELFNRIPDLPATAQEAALWVDKGGRLVQPGLLALKADIDAHVKTVERIARESEADHKTQTAYAVEDLGKGLADVGVDMERIQRDPVYARQVQERMRRMSPQELIAMSQKMSAPLAQDKRRHNEAQAMVDDAAPIRAAAEAGRAYTEQQMARMSAHQAIWRDADAEIGRIRSKRLTVAAAKPTMEADNIGCEKACQAQWDAYASQMLPLMEARATEILKLRRAALQRQRAAVAAEIKTADQHLKAAQYGVPSRSQNNRMNVFRYDGAAIGELQMLVARIEESVGSAGQVVHCGKQIVLVPLAVCR